MRGVLWGAVTLERLRLVEGALPAGRPLGGDLGHPAAARGSGRRPELVLVRGVALVGDGGGGAPSDGVVVDHREGGQLLADLGLGGDGDRVGVVSPRVPLAVLLVLAVALVLERVGQGVEVLVAALVLLEGLGAEM